MLKSMLKKIPIILFLIIVLAMRGEAMKDKSETSSNKSKTETLPSLFVILTTSTIKSIQKGTNGIIDRNPPPQVASNRIQRTERNCSFFDGLVKFLRSFLK